MIIRLLIIFCAKKALKYQQMIVMFVNQENVDHIYATGTMVVHRDKWLKRVGFLEKILTK